MKRLSYAEKTAMFWAEDTNPGWEEGWDDWHYSAADREATREAFERERVAAEAVARTERSDQLKAKAAAAARKERERQHAVDWLECGVPGRYRTATFEGFKPATELQRAALVACERFPFLSDDEDDIRTARNLWLLGPVGRGKTHLACAVLRAQHQAGESVVFTTPRDLVAELRGSTAARKQAMARYTDCYALVIDDVGTSFGGDTELLQLLDIVNERDAYDLHTIVTSNLSPSELREFLGDRIFSRLKDRALILVLDGEDFRKPV